MQRDLVRVLLVDDEPLVRQGMSETLSRRPGIEVVGEAVDGFDAIETIERLRPDLIFLDVQMPGLDGFGVLQNVEIDPRPAVVFVTAYEQYALKAFEAHAIDYLLKPFDDTRLLSALERAISWIVKDAASDDRVTRFLNTQQRNRFVVKQAGRLRSISADEVVWIEARGNYVHLHAPGGPYLLRETLTSLAESLAKDRFVRVHRSCIVALEEVTGMERQSSGDYELLLRTGDRVPVGRSFRDSFMERWKGTSTS